MTQIAFILKITKIIPPDTLEGVREKALQVLEAKKAELEVNGVTTEQLRDSFIDELFLRMIVDSPTKVAVEFCLETVAELEGCFGNITTCFLDGEKIPRVMLGYELGKKLTD